MDLGRPHYRAHDLFVGGWTRQIDLALGKAVHVADGTLELVSATSAWWTGGRERTSAYCFTFRFRGGR